MITLPRPDRARRRFVGEVLLIGLLWGFAVASLEAMTFPIEQVEALSLLAWIFLGLPQFGLQGVVLAAGVSWAARSGRGWLAPLAMAAAALTSAAVFVAYRLKFTAGPDRLLGPFYKSDTQWFDAVVHQLWLCLCYGGLLAVAWILVERGARIERVLATTRLARDRSTAELERTRLQELHGQVDPAQLLATLAEVQRRYAHDVAGADRLLDQLVAFLRAAMPALRDGVSTLADELRRVEAHAALAAALEPGRPGWSIRVETPLPEIAFPPLLLPLLESVSSDARCRVPIRLSVTVEPMRLRIEGGRPGGSLDEALAYRWRVALDAACGPGWTLVQHAADASIELTLPGACAPSPGVPATSTHPPGGVPWTTLSTATS